MDFKQIITECYSAIPTMPGWYIDFNVLYESVCQKIQNEGAEIPSKDDFLQKLNELFANVKYLDKYTYSDESTGETKIIPAIRFSEKQSIPELPEAEKEKLRRNIKDVISQQLSSDNGWYELVRINPILTRAGIKYKELGFPKLSDLLSSIFPDYQREERGDELHHNVIFVNLGFDSIKQSQTSPKIVTNILTTRKTNSRNTRKSAYDKLMDFAIFLPFGVKNPGFTNAINQLAEKALGENWYYGTTNRGTNPILRNYLLLTFERLLEEDEEHKDEGNWKMKILTKDDKYAVFNTGLVDKLYEPVYAFFVRNTKESAKQKWKFHSFVRSTDRERQTLTRIFGANLPSPAHYYNSTSELVYNIKATIGSYNWDHFIDHCERLPLDFLRDNGPTFDYDAPKSRNFYRDLALAIKADARSFNRIKNRIEDAIDYAIKRVRWNFKTAIPIYYPGQKEISLLLPLALGHEDEIDVALVLEATESGDYIAHTILTLEMAYTNARLITRPDSDWLTADKIIPQES